MLWTGLPGLVNRTLNTTFPFDTRSLPTGKPCFARFALGSVLFVDLCLHSRVLSNTARKRQIYRQRKTPGKVTFVNSCAVTEVGWAICRYDQRSHGNENGGKLKTFYVGGWGSEGSETSILWLVMTFCGPSGSQCRVCDRYSQNAQCVALIYI